MADVAKLTPAAQKAADEVILKTARERFQIAVTAEDARRQRQLFDYKFSIGRKNERESYQYSKADVDVRGDRPMLTNNRIGPHCRQVANQIRQARQSIKAVPVDSGADVDKAEVRQALFRRIEARSKAPVAYLTATDHQVRMGEGFVRVVPQFIDGTGPRQELKIKGIRNRFSVYADPASVELDGSDWEWLFITEDLPKETYNKKWATTDAASLENFNGYGDTAPTWFIGGKVRIAEYFYVETAYEKGEAKSRKVCWVKLNGIEILDRRTLPIPMIPVVRLVGEVTDVEGEVDYRGVVPDAMDPQKMLNYTESATAEAMGVAPKAGYEAYAASVEGHPEWDDANAKNYSVLKANTVDPENKQIGLLPLPKRGGVTPDLSAFVVAGARAENNLRAALGVVDVDAAERAKEQSGRAIRARQQQSDVSNSHFGENQSLMIQQVGRILNAWVEFIYDAPYVMEIVGEDNKRRRVMLHSGSDMVPQELPEGVKPENVFDLKIGRFDIEIATGPSQLTDRQEAVERLDGFIKAFPPAGAIIGHVLAANMDGPGMQEAAALLKKAAIKSGAIEDDDKDQQQPEIPPQVKAQMDELQKQHELLVQELNAKTQEVETQQAKAQADAQVKQAAIASDEAQKMAEIASEEKIAAAKLQQEYRLAVLKMANDRQIAEMKAQQAHDAMMSNAFEGQQDRQHEAQQGHQERQQDRELHDSDLQTQTAESQASREHERQMQKEAPKPNGASA